MPFWFTVVCLLSVHWKVQASLLPSASQKALQYLELLPAEPPRDSLINISLPDHPVHSLYSGDKLYYQKPHQLLQQSLHPQDDHASEFIAGTINMLSTAGHFVALDFAFTLLSCELDTDALLLTHEPASWVLAAYPSGTQEADQTIQETIMLNTRATEYRVTLSLTIDGAIDGVPFLGLMKLLVRATEALFLSTGKDGFGTLVQKGSFEKVEFEAWWTWYEFVDEVGRRCHSGSCT